jgi:hypothetical protein
MARIKHVLNERALAEPDAYKSAELKRFIDAIWGRDGWHAPGFVAEGVKEVMITHKKLLLEEGHTMPFNAEQITKSGVNKVAVHEPTRLTFPALPCRQTTEHGSIESDCWL